MKITVHLARGNSYLIDEKGHVCVKTRGVAYGYVLESRIQKPDLRQPFEVHFRRIDDEIYNDLHWLDYAG